MFDLLHTVALTSTILGITSGFVGIAGVAFRSEDLRTVGLIFATAFFVILAATGVLVKIIY